MLCASCGEDVTADPCPACRAQPRLAGRYELVRPLGHGASGVMWLARSEETGLVAIKELRVTGDAKAIELIGREAKVLKELSHPQIPAYVEDFATGSGRHRCHCVVQQFIEGRTLAEVLRDEGRQRLDGAIAVVEQLIGPLSYLHGLSPPVVHRDLKPENIIVRPDGTLVIVDFGSVRDAWKGTFGGSTVAGTFAYMAPEQFQGDASPASDVYALGVLLVELLSRKDPATLRDRTRRFHWRDHVRVPPAWEELIASMLSDDPDERPRDAAALFVAMQEAHAVPAPVPESPRAARAFREVLLWRWVRPEDKPFLGVAGGLVALFCAGVLATPSWRSWIVGSLVGEAPDEREMRIALTQELLEGASRCLSSGDEVRGSLVVATGSRHGRFVPGDDVWPDVRDCVGHWAESLEFVVQSGDDVEIPLDWLWRPTYEEGIVRLRNDGAKGAVSTVTLAPGDYHRGMLLTSAKVDLWVPESRHVVLEDVPPGTYSVPASGGTKPADLVISPGSDCVFRWVRGDLWSHDAWEGTCVPRE